MQKVPFISKFVHRDTFELIILSIEHTALQSDLHHWAQCSSFRLTVTRQTVWHITSFHFAWLMDKCRSSSSLSISTAVVGWWTLLQFWRRWSGIAHILRWEYLPVMWISWTHVLMLWRIMAWMLSMRGLWLLLSTRITPRARWVVAVPRRMELLLRGLHSGPRASVARLHEHVRVIILHIGLLLGSRKWMWHVVGSTSTARASKLWLHRSLMIVHCHSLITSAVMVEILLLLSFLVLLVTRLALILSVLFCKWWASLACFTAEFSGFAWWCFSNWILWLILFADSILTITIDLLTWIPASFTEGGLLLKYFLTWPIRIVAWWTSLLRCLGLFCGGRFDWFLHQLWLEVLECSMWHRLFWCSLLSLLSITSTSWILSREIINWLRSLESFIFSLIILLIISPLISMAVPLITKLWVEILRLLLVEAPRCTIDWTLATILRCVDIP